MRERAEKSKPQKSKSTKRPQISGQNAIFSLQEIAKKF